MATTMEGLQRQIEESNNTTIDDIDDQLNYLLNKTVRMRAPAFPSFNTAHESVIKKGDSIMTMSMDTLIAKTKELHDKIRNENKHWWTFSDVAPTWEGNISKVFAGKMGDKENREVTKVLLSSAARCIMGESYGGSHWGTCPDCGWLGGTSGGLRLFTSNNMIDSEKQSGYVEYRMRYEYHWNKYHYDMGNKESEVPSL